MSERRMDRVGKVEQLIFFTFDDSPSNGNALLLAARHLFGEVREV